MKALILATAVAGLAIVSPLSAQGRARTSTINAQSRQDCRNQSNPVDVILGRGANSSSNCTYGSRDGAVDGQWRPVSQDRNGNTIYVRRTYDRNGNIVVQRAVRDSYGRMSVIDTRTYNGNGNGAWNNGRRNANGKYKHRGHDDGDDDDQGRYDRGRNDDSNYRYDQFGNRVYVGPTNNRVNSGSTRRFEESKQREHGRGRGKKDRD